MDHLQFIHENPCSLSMISHVKHSRCMYTSQISEAVICMRLMFRIFYLFGLQQKKPKELKLVIKDCSPLSFDLKLD